jgi:hypothetical protein
MITERIPRSSDLLVALPPWSREKLAPQARQVFRDLDQVVQGLPGLSGLWIRSPSPPAGRQDFWQVGSTWQGPPRPWSVGTHGYPCLTSPRSTCRRSGGDEATSKRSEDVASMEPHRVHGDQKRKSSSARTKANVKSLESRSRGLKWRQGVVAAWRTADLTGTRWSQRTFKEGQNADQREVERRREGSVLPVGRGDVKKKRASQRRTRRVAPEQ